MTDRAADERSADRFTAVLEQDGDRWNGSVAEPPSANAEGRTLDKTRDNLKDAVRLVIEANRGIARRDAADWAGSREELLLSA